MSHYRGSIFERPKANEEQVFVTGENESGHQVTVPAIMKAGDLLCYGQSLDPDAEEHYDVSPGLEAEVEIITGAVAGPAFPEAYKESVVLYHRFKIWRNGKGNQHEVIADFEVPRNMRLSDGETLATEAMFNHPVHYGGKYMK